MGEQKWPILPAMETHKNCKNAAKATFALQQSFCPTFSIEIVYRSPTKDKPCQPMSSFKNKLASSQIKHKETGETLGYLFFKQNLVFAKILGLPPSKCHLAQDIGISEWTGF